MNLKENQNTKYKYIFIEKAWTSSSGLATIYEYKNKLYTTSFKDLEDFKITTHEQLVGMCVVINPEVSIKKVGSSDYYGVSKKSIIEITNDDKKINEFKSIIKAEYEILNSQCFADIKIIKPEVKNRYSFSEAFDNASRVNKSSERMNSAEKLIEESNILSEDKYLYLNRNDDINLEVLLEMSEGKLFEFIYTIDSDQELILRKIPKTKIPIEYQENKKKLIAYLETIIDQSNKQLLDSFNKFKHGEIELFELINEIDYINSEKYNYIARLAEKNEFIIQWPYIVGKTQQIEGEGNYIYCPLTLQSFSIVEQIDSIKLIKNKAPLKINTFPILKTYVDYKSEVVNKITNTHNDFSEIFNEFFKHKIKFNRPLNDQIEINKNILLQDIEEMNLTPGTFEILNHASITIKEVENQIHDELEKIYSKYSTFPIPLENFVLSDKNIKDKNKNYIFNVDDSKAASVKNSITDSMVIFGPPGTGKTETISSIVGEVIKMNSNALLVAEMSTALEAIQSKLSEVSLDKFSLFIKDDENMSSYFREKINWIREQILKPYREYETTDPQCFEDNWINQSKEFISFISNINERGISHQNIFDCFNAFVKSEMKFIDFVNIFNILKNQDQINLAHQESDELTKQINNAEFEKSNIHILLQNEYEKFINLLVNEFSVEISKSELSSSNDKKQLWNLINSKRDQSLINLLDLKTVIKIKDKINNYFKEVSLIIDKIKQHDQLIKEHVSRVEDIKSMLSVANVDKLNHAKDVIERFNLNEEFLNQNIDLLDSLRHLVMKSENLDSKWDNHLNSINEHINLQRKITISSHITYLKHIYNQDEEFRNVFIKIAKFVDGNISIEESNEKVYKLLKDNFKYILIMFPIIMIRPDLVSKIAPLERGVFDYSIFDEASQIRLFKAMPSIYRSKKVVVSGDDKQLSPNDAFTDIRTSEDFEFSSLSDNKFAFKTLLDWAKSNYKNSILSTHYRSKAKELIEFSNNEFYRGLIEVIDSPHSRFDGNEPIIVEEVNGWFEQDEDKEYKISGSRNIIEAKRVVELFWEYFVLKRKFVGIVTFSEPQKKLITRLITEKIANEGIDLNNHKQTFFVKNINDVQGDEKDVIIFSIVYGKWKGLNIPVKNFMRVSKEKINVAITRAKYRLHIVKSINSNEIDERKVKADEDIAVFQKWLRYIEQYSNPNKQIKEIDKFQNDYENEFLNKLQSSLPDQFEIITNLNVGIKQIDIAIFDMHKNIFVGGIEFTSTSKYLTEENWRNEYPKQILLEAQGWKIIFINFWDYYISPDELINYCLNKFAIK